MLKAEGRFADARYFDREGARDAPALWSSRSARGMVVTAHYRATEAGAAILEAGGNAIDAAVAASLALAVCESAGSGLGGMGMMLVHDPGSGRTFGVQGPCRAPKAATAEAVSVADRYRGYRAVAVPTLVSVLRHAHERYGSLSARELLVPAIRLARGGFTLTAMQHRLLARHRTSLQQGNAASLFLDASGEPPRAGALFRQPRLADTLGRLARAGFRDFYQGELADEIAADMEANGGFVAREDLAALPPPREVEPLHVRFRRSQVLTLGPPAGGLAVLQMLALLQATGRRFDPDTPADALRLAAIIRRARTDRRRYRLRTEAEGLGKARRLLKRSYAQRASAEITASLDGLGETSHFCVADGAGRVVSMTQSIERSFGAGVATPSLGFLYNGYLRAFKVKNTRHPHYLRPGAPARSNAAPTLVLRAGRLRAALGSTGSERMASSIFQVLVRLPRQTPFEAVHAPRLHCTPEGRVLVEGGRVPDAVVNALEAGGLVVQRLDPYAFQMGGLQLVVRDGDDYVGVTEPRRDGAAAGPD